MTSYNKNDPKTIQSMFSSIAKSYDKTNAVLSFQMHKHWNQNLVRLILSQQPEILLDLCCGTGEITYAYLSQARSPCQVYLLDFCQEMLVCAEEKAKKLSINPLNQLSFIQADAQVIPLPSNSISCTTIAYGIRNVKDPSKCIREVFRVLKPGGTLGILELTQPTNPFLRMGHYIYLRTLLPLLGWCMTANQSAYQYLSSSIHTFVEPKILEKTIIEAGFTNTECISLSGGIATILFAKKSS